MGCFLFDCEFWRLLQDLHCMGVLSKNGCNAKFSNFGAI